MEFLSCMFETVPVWLLWSVVVGIILYWYLTRPYNHWEKAGVPHISPVPIFGSALQMLLAGSIHETHVKNYKKKGRIHGGFQGRIPVLMVGEPDIIRNILVKDFQFFTSRQRFGAGDELIEKMVSAMQGEDWKRVRTVMTPAFSTGKIKRMLSIFSDSSKTLLENFAASAKEGKPVDMKRLFGAFTMDVIASSAFATKLDSHKDPDNPFVTHAKTIFANQFPWRALLFLTFPEISRFFHISIFPSEAMKFFKKVTLQIVEERRRSKQRRNDFLQLLLDAVERDGEKEVEDTKENEEIMEMGHEEGNEQVFKSYQSKRSLSNLELVANCVTFFIAGYDTTASTLTFVAYELAMNPDIQDKLIAEIDETIREKGELNYEAISEMKYLDNVISETLRKYPPVIGTDRLAEEDYEIESGDIKVTVMKGNPVVIPAYAIHHDPEHYPDPERFDPDRFTPEQKSKRHPYVYLPFGAGPRNCVGMRFALMEIKVCLANVLTQFHFRTCSKTDVPIQFLRGLGLLQPKRVLLNMEPRVTPRNYNA